MNLKNPFEQQEQQPVHGEIDLIVNPRYHFTTPQAVLEAEGLTGSEKQLILAAWEEELANEIYQDERMPQTRYGEFMEPEELEAVRRALRRVARRQIAA